MMRWPNGCSPFPSRVQFRTGRLLGGLQVLHSSRELAGEAYAQRVRYGLCPVSESPESGVKLPPGWVQARRQSEAATVRGSGLFQPRALLSSPRQSVVFLRGRCVGRMAREQRTRGASSPVAPAESGRFPASGLFREANVTIRVLAFSVHVRTITTRRQCHGAGDRYWRLRPPRPTAQDTGLDFSMSLWLKPHDCAAPPSPPPSKKHRVVGVTKLRHISPGFSARIGHARRDSLTGPCRKK